MTGAALGLSGTVLLCAAEAAGSPSVPGARPAGHTVLGVGLGLVAGLTYALMSWAAHRLISRGITSRAAMGPSSGSAGCC
jgi:DME family drug/metabolite transporter